MNGSITVFALLHLACVLKVRSGSGVRQKGLFLLSSAFLPTPSVRTLPPRPLGLALPSEGLVALSFSNVTVSHLPGRLRVQSVCSHRPHRPAECVARVPAEAPQGMMGGDPLPVVGDPISQVLPVHGAALGSDHLCLLLPGDRCLLVSPKVELKSLFLVLLVF